MRHPALDDAARGVDKLRMASDRIHSANPVEALQHVDCEPEAVRARTRAVFEAAELVGQAADIVARAVAAARQGWRGEAADAFGRAGEGAVSHLRATHDRTDATGRAGQAIADRLDALARDAGAASTSSARGADPACDVVLGGGPSHPHFVEAAERVNLAVNDVITVCERAVTEVGQLGAVLDGLA
ncbi:hypothetical protein LX15_003114 [Streptoalloteichus tenebrarius]|uniref:Uncharacterized protein n=1 Tax=Streptoalloteichus tenebrarius (strain ATCC 17920 / DSM 40477 / JCM 4838 / CBS 697.72 / NBRC 16177 / NCIMB 11028 / NRRL B-12390 / A12253. 1 / ISP 5477) TaxID=1933 RepID=A0ABT1HV54_STRSD|nr:hypothetical protein [Streptoalloteichus tenebrarius]MCP2259413.1 hypothetical protein [Streptoalloteichus tenebrarius]BFF02356.1 hypothetical protein GCM10020241_40310 [Streptoalloteichus tenebrarius]